MVLAASALTVLAGLPARAQDSDGRFRAFVESVWPQAQAAGVSRQTFDAAFAGVKFNPSVARSSAAQAEFVKPVWSYLQSTVTSDRINKGREMAARYRDTLAAIERRYGVNRHVVLAVWGIETSYGGFTGKLPVIRQIASLAHAGVRPDFYRAELVSALVILQQGHIAPGQMIGSWAGAMGQTQFMPSSFLKHTVDFDGDGRKNLWTSVPDALASTANYLRNFGWQGALSWGYEIALPAGFDLARHELLQARPFSHWTAQGLKRVNGQPMPRSGEGFLMLPAGVNGPAFLMTENFRVIKEYNRANSYALAVGHLTDRIAGSGPLSRPWPKGGKGLSVREARELQQRLQQQGLYKGKIDGMFGDLVTTAVRNWQVKAGVVADGYPGPSVLQQMRNRR
ncbi:MAG: lytic murein transglycosylase [Alphaproteobacteria bacterium]|nr:lytic murein transglycosylase [Alphaproteobacteria bacterium]